MQTNFVFLMKHKNKNNSAKNLNKKEIKMGYFVGNFEYRTYGFVQDNKTR